MIRFSNAFDDYFLQIVQDPCDLPPDWDVLLSQQPHTTPFMSRAYLAALHRSGSALAETGWQPHFVLLWQGDARHATLAAACPAYLKSHSRGEYVFDHGWANAYAQHGLDYYPKLLCAVPFTPVQGARLLAIDSAARNTLIAALQAQAQTLGASGVHVLFGSQADQDSTHAAQWACRHTVQFHWHNKDIRHGAVKPFTDFEAFLSTLARDKAKKARAEMRKVATAGVQWRTVLAADANDAEREVLRRCYAQTYLEHGNAPYLQPAFFDEVFRTMPHNWLLCIASHAEFLGGDFACSLIGLDPLNKVAYGRYWGALARVDCLHFDACYYQPLRWCIENGFQRFEGGAQGEHKMARGLMPVVTPSAHYIAHPQFAKAITDFTVREQHGVQGYMDDLAAHSPMKADNVAGSR